MSQRIVPPCRSTIRRQVARPRPVPGTLPDTSRVKGSNIRSRNASDTPGPLSSTVISTNPSCRTCPSIRTTGACRSQNLIALPIRFWKSCATCGGAHSGALGNCPIRMEAPVPSTSGRRIVTARMASAPRSAGSSAISRPTEICASRLSIRSIAWVAACSSIRNPVRASSRASWSMSFRTQVAIRWIALSGARKSCTRMLAKLRASSWRSESR